MNCDTRFEEGPGHRRNTVSSIFIRPLSVKDVEKSQTSKNASDN
jgi:hypothetical protein